MDEAELKQKLEALGLEEGDPRIPGIVCQLIGHSRIQTYCFGYYSCARCDAQVGDSLGGVYLGAKQTVVVGHNCETCRDNYSKLGWQDKFMCPDPFAVPEPEPEEVTNP